MGGPHETTQIRQREGTTSRQWSAKTSPIGNKQTNNHQVWKALHRQKRGTSESQLGLISNFNRYLHIFSIYEGSYSDFHLKTSSSQPRLGVFAVLCGWAERLWLKAEKRSRLKVMKGLTEKSLSLNPHLSASCFFLCVPRELGWK